MTKQNPWLSVMAGLSASAGLALLACVNGPMGSSDCPAEDPIAQVDVAGTWRYSGADIFKLRGTITFEQQGSQVRVTDTTYDNSGDRRLQSEFTPLQGNKLVIVLTPKNGDTDYRADVTFLFRPDGDRFCVEFSDTNGDSGPMGTYTGFKQ